MYVLNSRSWFFADDRMTFKAVVALHLPPRRPSVRGVRQDFRARTCSFFRRRRRRRRSVKPANGPTAYTVGYALIYALL